MSLLVCGIQTTAVIKKGAKSPFLYKNYFKMKDKPWLFKKQSMGNSTRTVIRAVVSHIIVCL
jgi:hypothetical protein